MTTAGDRTPVASASGPMSARVPTVTRSPVPYASSTIATGQSSPRVPAASVAADRARPDTPISSTTVWSRPPGSSASWSWPVTTVKPAATPRWVTGMPATAGSGDGARHARHHLHGHAGVSAERELFAAATEHVRVAALQPENALARLRVPDEDRVDLVLRHRVVTGQLADVDHRHAIGEPGEQCARAEPVGHHDIRLREKVASAHGDEVGVAGAATDECDGARGEVDATRAR